MTNVCISTSSRIGVQIYVNMIAPIIFYIEIYDIILTSAAT